MTYRVTLSESASPNLRATSVGLNLIQRNIQVDLFIRMRAKQDVPRELVIDFDATDDPIHSNQLGKFFHGYYKCYCYLPLYAFCDGWPLLALLRPSNIDASLGTVEALMRIVPKLREAWPESSFAVTAVSVARKSCGGARKTTSITCSDWRRTNAW